MEKVIETKNTTFYVLAMPVMAYESFLERMNKARVELEGRIIEESVTASAALTYVAKYYVELPKQAPAQKAPQAKAKAE